MNPQLLMFISDVFCCSWFIYVSKLRLCRRLNKLLLISYARKLAITCLLSAGVRKSLWLSPSLSLYPSLLCLNNSWLINWLISLIPSCTCWVQWLAQWALLRVHPVCVGSSWVLQLPPPPTPSTPRTWCNSGCSLEWEWLFAFFNVALSFTWWLVQSPAPPGIGDAGVEN